MPKYKIIFCVKNEKREILTDDYQCCCQFLQSSIKDLCRINDDYFKSITVEVLK